MHGLPVIRGQLPYVVGLTTAQATARLHEAGYDRISIGNTRVADTDIVMDMTPLHWTHPPFDTEIILTLGLSGNASD